MNKKNENKLILELALYLNNQLLKEKKITYKMYKSTEDYILKHLK